MYRRQIERSNFQNIRDPYTERHCHDIFLPTVVCYEIVVFQR